MRHHAGIDNIPPLPKRPELLAPAGNMEKLRIAVHYGADAVYLGGEGFSLRNLAGNFTLDELAEAVAYSHAHGVKVYLTINSYPANPELQALNDYLLSIAQISFDAYIVADPGVLDMVREISPDRDIHLSTQANTVNWRSVIFWEKQGIKRVNMAREMSLEEMRETRARTSVELETFAHGAMCISYSGRCLLSSVMSGRNANRGECTHPCRWNYALVEETRPGVYYPVIEEDGGTFIFNSKDLCLLPHLPELIGSGIDSLKIEGRMKGIYYLASVVQVYRAAIDRYCQDPASYEMDPSWMEELCKISHRGYTTGFLLGPPRDLDHQYDARYIRTHEFVGIVEGAGTGCKAVIGVRNRLEAGDTVEVISRSSAVRAFTIMEMSTPDGMLLTAANPNQKIMLDPPFPLAPFDILRKTKA
ncbi:MAG: U32 family peptidase [Geobacter sp.]|nr:U32 family peptidase [Geobacter sp.]